MFLPPKRKTEIEGKLRKTYELPISVDKGPGYLVGILRGFGWFGCFVFHCFGLPMDLLLCELFPQ